MLLTWYLQTLPLYYTLGLQAGYKHSEGFQKYLAPL